MKRRNQIAVAGVTVLALGALGTGAVAATGVANGDGDDTAITGAAKDEAEQAALDEVGEGQVTGSEVDDEEGKYEVEVTKDDGTEVDVHLDESFAVISTDSDGTDSDDGDTDDTAITGAAKDKAEQAALNEVGEGQVTDTEADADGSYEVEVTKDDGTEIDVHLDEGFAVTGTDTDGTDGTDSDDFDDSDDSDDEDSGDDD